MTKSITNLAPTLRVMIQLPGGTILLQTTELPVLPSAGDVLRIAGGRYRVTHTPHHWEDLANDPRVRIEVVEEYFNVD